MLIAITGVDLPDVEDGGIYLVGYRTALYPISKDASSQSLQWHFITANLSVTMDGESEHEDDHRLNQSLRFSWHSTGL